MLIFSWIAIVVLTHYTIILYKLYNILLIIAIAKKLQMVTNCVFALGAGVLAA